ncbi:MAG: hypothetical protein ACK5UY_05975 [Holosporales bacterium]
MIGLITPARSILNNDTPPKKEEETPSAAKQQLQGLLRGMFVFSSKLTTGDTVEAYIDWLHKQIDAGTYSHDSEETNKQRNAVNYKGIFYDSTIFKSSREVPHVKILNAAKETSDDQAKVILRAFDLLQKIYEKHAPATATAAKEALTCFKESMKMESSSLPSILGITNKHRKIHIYPGYKIVELWKIWITRAVVLLELFIERLTGFGPLKKIRQIVNFFKAHTKGTPTNNARESSFKGVEILAKTRPEISRLMVELNENVLPDLEPASRPILAKLLNYSGMTNFSPQNADPMSMLNTDVQFHNSWGKVQPHSAGYEINQLLNRLSGAEESCIGSFQQSHLHRDTYAAYSLLDTFYVPEINKNLEEMVKHVADFWGNDPVGKTDRERILQALAIRRTRTGSIGTIIDLYTTLTDLTFSGVSKKINTVRREAVANEHNRINDLLLTGDDRYRYAARLAAEMAMYTETMEAAMRNNKDNVHMDPRVRELLDGVQTILPFAKTGKELGHVRSAEMAGLTTLYTNLIDFNLLQSKALNPENKNPVVIHELAVLTTNILSNLQGLTAGPWMNTPNTPLLQTMVDRFNSAQAGLKLPSPCRTSTFVKYFGEVLGQKVREVYRVLAPIGVEPGLKITDLNPLTDSKYTPRNNPKVEKSVTFNNIIKGGALEAYILEPDILALRQLARQCRENENLQILAASPEERAQKLQNVLLGLHPDAQETDKPDDKQEKINNNPYKDIGCVYLQEQNIELRNQAFYNGNRQATTRDRLCPNFQRITPLMAQELFNLLHDICPQLTPDDIIPMMNPAHNPDPALNKKDVRDSAFGRFHNKDVADIYNSNDGHYLRLRFQGSDANNGQNGTEKHWIYWMQNNNKTFTSGSEEFAVAYLSQAHFRDSVARLDTQKKALMEEYTNKYGDPKYWNDATKEAFKKTWGAPHTTTAEEYARQDPWIGTHYQATAAGTKDFYNAAVLFNEGTLKQRGYINEHLSATNALAKALEQIYPVASACSRALEINTEWLTGKSENDDLNHSPPDRMSFGSSWAQMWGIFGWVGGILGSWLDNVLAIFNIKLYQRQPRASTNTTTSGSVVQNKDGRTFSRGKFTEIPHGFAFNSASMNFHNTKKMDNRVEDGRKALEEAYKISDMWGTFEDFLSKDSNARMDPIQQRRRANDSLYITSEQLSKEYKEAVEKNNVVHFMKKYALQKT